MSRNIEINYLNESNEYEVLYPATIKSQITDFSISADEVLAGTFPGQVLANSTAESTTTVTQLRNIYFGTTNMSAGSSVLPTGEIYLVYE